MKRIPKRPRDGASTVEFALVLPILFATILGCIGMGQVIGAHQVLTHASRAGCRKAALATTTSTTDVETVVRDYLKRGSIPTAVADAATVTVTPSPSTSTDTETTMTVSVSVGFDEVSWLPTGIFPYVDELTLTGSSIMERE